MKITTEVQIGSNMQAIYLVDNNEHPTLIAYSKIYDLGTILCAFYYTYHCDTIVIAASRELANKIAGDALAISKEYYAEHPPLHIEII